MIGLYIMTALYIIAGMMHFINPKFYLAMMPDFIPFHKFCVYASGVVEIVLGVLLLFENYRPLAAWGIIGLLIAVFPANINMLINSQKFKATPPYVLWIRLPIQFIFIWLAYQYV